MLVPSEITIMAPVPSRERRSRTESKSSATSRSRLVNRVLRAAGEYRLEFLLPTMPPPCEDELFQTGAHGQLAGAEHVAGQGIELGAGRVADAEIPVPRRTVPQDVRDVGEGLDIVDDGRRAMHAILGREGRLPPGKGEIASIDAVTAVSSPLM